jgi:hypothetical protein
MGRSPFFTLSQVELPPPTDASEALNELKVGQFVQFSFGKYCPNTSGLPGVYRSISTYEYIPSAVSSRLTYQITSIDAIPAFHELGIRVISVINVNHSNPKMHMDGCNVMAHKHSASCIQSSPFFWSGSKGSKC